MSNAKACTTPLCNSKKLSKDGADLFDKPSLYRSIIGALQYLTLSCPDIAFLVNKLSQYLQHPTIDHWQACKRVLRYLKGTTQYGLHFTPTAPHHFVLEGNSDADKASCLDDRRSTSGHCIYLGGNLIAWSSKKKPIVARSSTEFEYRALAQAATELFWLQYLFHEIDVTLSTTRCLVIWCDNIGASALASI